MTVELMLIRKIESITADRNRLDPADNTWTARPMYVQRVIGAGMTLQVIQNVARCSYRSSEGGRQKVKDPIASFELQIAADSEKNEAFPALRHTERNRIERGPVKFITFGSQLFNKHWKPRIPPQSRNILKKKDSRTHRLNETSYIKNQIITILIDHTLGQSRESLARRARF